MSWFKPKQKPSTIIEPKKVTFVLTPEQTADVASLLDKYYATPIDQDHRDRHNLWAYISKVAASPFKKYSGNIDTSNIIHYAVTYVEKL